MDRPDFSNPCRGQLCLTRGGIKLTVDIVDSTKIKPLTSIINQTLETGFFPANLKIAQIIPIFKKGDRTAFNNCRPNSLLPIISKVVEKVTSDQLNA